MKNKHCEKVTWQKRIEAQQVNNDKLRKIFKLSAVTLNVRHAIRNMGKGS